MQALEFLEAVKAAGVVGEGGAGFPSHVKYAAKVDTVIANGCECEPLLRSDYYVLDRQGREVLRALAVLAGAAGAGRAVLALKKKHHALAAALRPSAAAQGVELFLLEDFYPAGDEQILIREVTGRSVPPLGLPAQAGAMVTNVATLAKVDAALGGDGALPEPAAWKILTVTGEVRRPAVLRAPLGASLAECLEACGGARVSDPVFILGGPMMGRFIGGPEDLRREAVTKTSGGILVLPAGSVLHRNATMDTAVLRRRAASACIQCRLCSDLCPRRLIGHPLETHRVMRAFSAGGELAEDPAGLAGSQALLCCECGVCEHYACPMGMSPRRINQAVKNSLRKANRTYTGKREILPEHHALREYRKTPLSRLAARLGIASYMGLATPYIGDIRPGLLRVPLRQHIGVPALPVVREGDRIRAGDLLGEIPKGALGARVHTGLGGLVTKVDDYVWIEVRHG